MPNQIRIVIVPFDIDTDTDADTDLIDRRAIVEGLLDDGFTRFGDPVSIEQGDKNALVYTLHKLTD